MGKRNINFNKYKFIKTISLCLITIILSGSLPSFGETKEINNSTREKINDNMPPAEDMNWMVGIARRVITPTTDVWLAGYGVKRPPEGKLTDIWVKVLALKSKNGKRVVMVTTDNQGMSRTVYESIYKKVHQQFNLDRSEFMLTFSHNHSGPRLRGDLVNYYPTDDDEDLIVDEYTKCQEEQIMDAVREALKNMQPAQLFRGEGLCTFAVNRQTNIESEVPELMAEHKLKGPVDHYVPVLSVKDNKGKLLAVLFGYACHPTTIETHMYSGDYPGFAQINLENRYPGVTAMFFNASGGDQNPLPRGTVELCEKYGKMLSDAVEDVIAKPMQPISSSLKTAFKFVNLDYEKVVTKDTLLLITLDTVDASHQIHARWARSMLRMLDKGVKFSKSYQYYPVQAWNLGKGSNDLLMIATGGETVVGYSLRFKREYGEESTWVCGYSNIMVAYIPTRKVWERGGYEGGPHIDEYGHPAWRWAGNVEDRVAKGVHYVVKRVHKR